jgi:hypothetical protein
MSDTFPVFSSEELRKAVTEAKPIIEGLDEARNRLSEDIKHLESYLQRLDLKVPFRCAYGMCLVAYDSKAEQHIAADLEYGGAASGWIEEEALVWAEQKPGKFRLMYEHSRWDGYVEVDAPGGPYFRDEETLERDQKPLIETPFEIRKKMYPHLPDFVRALSNNLSVEKRPVWDDIRLR